MGEQLYEEKQDVLSWKQHFNESRRKNNIESYPISDLLTIDVIVLILLNRMWKVANYRENEITDLEEMVLRESGMYIYQKIKDSFERSEYIKCLKVPFSEWNITVQQLLDNIIMINNQLTTNSQKQKSKNI